MGWFKKIKKAVRKAVGADKNKPKMPVPDATLGPQGDGGGATVRRSVADRRKARAARGRDSTIITAGSQIGQRTLLG